MEARWQSLLKIYSEAGSLRTKTPVKKCRPYSTLFLRAILVHYSRALFDSFFRGALFLEVLCNDGVYGRVTTRLAFRGIEASGELKFGYPAVSLAV